MSTLGKSITVVGAGYVGMSLAVLLAQENSVIVLDVDKHRVDRINSNKSTIGDKDIDDFLAKRKLSLKATLDKKFAYSNAEIVIVATPTNFDPESKKFDTSMVDSVVEDAILLNKTALVVIKSTIPVGHTKALQKKYNTDKVIFSPEFLREGMALYDNLYPSRIIIGSKNDQARAFAGILASSAMKKDTAILFMESTEAESVKLFSNTYLALRVSFFNEMDSYALNNNLNAKSIIEGTSLDERIGTGYNNPSFGYGGYCLPKDTKQLLSNFKNTPQSLISASIESNVIRKKFIAEKILQKKPKTVGFYRLIMKEGSDNFRSSAIQDILDHVQKEEVKIIIYEPNVLDNTFNGFEVVKDIEIFKSSSDIIVANRVDDILNDVINKLFSRDIFGEN